MSAGAGPAAGDDVTRTRDEQRALIHALLLAMAPLERELRASETRLAESTWRDGQPAFEGALEGLRAARRRLRESEVLLRACLRDLLDGDTN